MTRREWKFHLASSHPRGRNWVHSTSLDREVAPPNLISTLRRGREGPLAKDKRPTAMEKERS